MTSASWLQSAANVKDDTPGDLIRHHSSDEKRVD